MKNLFSYLVIIFIFSSCFKTAEEIKREQEIDQQINQSSKTIAELTNTISQLKEQITSTSGQIEEIDYKRQRKDQEQSQSFESKVTQLIEQVNILTQDNKELKEKVSKLESDINGQKKYIKNVNSTLKQISGSESSDEKLKRAHDAFEKNKQEEAKTLYQEVLSENKINAAQKNHVLYNLGLLSYWAKKYDQAIVSFSKIYTKYPKSSFAPRSLLYIGRSFKAQNKKEEANAMFDELIKNYPKSSHATTAKKEMK